MIGRADSGGEVSGDALGGIGAEVGLEVFAAVGTSGAGEVQAAIADVGEAEDGASAEELAFDGEVPVLDAGVDEVAVNDVAIGADDGTGEEVWEAGHEAGEGGDLGRGEAGLGDEVHLEGRIEEAVAAAEDGGGFILDVPDEADAGGEVITVLGVALRETVVFSVGTP